jgi:uncharacterized protein (DUF2336 family)
MTSIRSALIEDDIRRLARDVAPHDRARAAERLCRRIDRVSLTAKEKAEAAEIIRLVLADAAEQVRRALAVTLKSSPLVPRDVANQLARDLESIAEPLLRFSPVFRDEDLAEIVRIGSPARQIAIAERSTLSPVVTTAIAEHGVVECVRTAVDNEGAVFNEAGLQRAIDRFETSETLLAAVALRASLPTRVVERLVGLVTDELRERLIERHGVAPQTAQVIAVGSRERATLDLVDQAGRAADLPDFVSHLHRSRRLTPSLMLRALANGYMSFFEWGLAELSGVPHQSTWLMVHDAGDLGLRAIYERAGLPRRLLPAFRAAVDSYHSLAVDEAPGGLERFQRRMLERFLTRADGVTSDDVDYLLDKIDRLAADAPLARVSASV